jgi:hypothetical protein
MLGFGRAAELDMAGPSNRRVRDVQSLAREGRKTATKRLRTQASPPLNRGPELDTLLRMSTPQDATATQAQFAFELLKLLLQVAWADEDVAPEEAEVLLVFARKQQLSQDKLELLRQCLAGRVPLPAPNLGFLKARRLEVMRAIKELLISDLSVADEEEAILEQISALLS